MTGQSPDDSSPPTDSENPSGNDDLNRRYSTTIISATRSVGRQVVSAVRASLIYRWLTAEPDPEVIVIDLRDTRTVGPVLRVLDKVVATLTDAASNSRIVAAGRTGYGSVLAAPLRVGGLGVTLLGLVVGLRSVLGELTTVGVGLGLGLVLVGLVAMRDDRDWDTLRATRPVEIAIAAFEPPEPSHQTEQPEPAQQSESQGLRGNNENEERDGGTSQEADDER